MTDEELIVEFALTRIDHPALDLEDVAELVVRRMDRETMLGFAARSLADRDELRGHAFATAVECVLRIVLKLRDGES